MSSKINHKKRSARSRRKRLAAARMFYVSNRKIEKEVSYPLYGKY